MSTYTYRSADGIEKAAKKGAAVIRVEEDRLFDAMCNLAAYSGDCVKTFAVKPVFLQDGLVFDVSIQDFLPYRKAQQPEPVDNIDFLQTALHEKAEMFQAIAP